MTLFKMLLTTQPIQNYDTQRYQPETEQVSVNVKDESVDG